MVSRLRTRISAVLFVARDVCYGDEGDEGKTRQETGELNLGLRLAHGKEFMAFQGANTVRGQAKKLFKRLSY